ncbi:MAG: hypothetical protein ABI237_13235 [Ginsengibacter sp.]
MKKTILTLFIGLLTAGAFAQTTAPATAASKDKHNDMKDLRKDVKDVRHDKKLRTYELKHHDKAEAKAETKDIKADNKDMHSDVKDLKHDGVKHPLKRADKQIHRQNVHRKH